MSKTDENDDSAAGPLSSPVEVEKKSSDNASSTSSPPSSNRWWEINKIFFQKNSNPLKVGDHVVRRHLFSQSHGIVIGSNVNNSKNNDGEGNTENMAFVIADFGGTSSSSSGAVSKEENDHDGDISGNGDDNNTGDSNPEKGTNEILVENPPKWLESERWNQYKRDRKNRSSSISEEEGEEEEKGKEGLCDGGEGGVSRIRLLFLTEEDEIKAWKKVHHGGDGKNFISRHFGLGGNNANTDTSSKSTESSSSWWWKKTHDNQDTTECKDQHTLSKDEVSSSPKEKSDFNEESIISNKQEQECDPTGLVLSRVEFLLDNPDLIPPPNLLISNSECLAVWCKTGQWCNIATSIFLHSTAVGQVKSATTLGLFAASQTVTVPAAGVWGWLGYTTQVSLMSTQPLLLPLIVGYGVVGVGVPYLVLVRCKKRWSEITDELNGKFWDQASSDVFVECIHHFSGLK